MGMDKSKLTSLGIFINTGVLLFLFSGSFTLAAKITCLQILSKCIQYSLLSADLREGNNVQFAGINVGTVKAIDILATDKIRVTMSIQEKVKEFIKKDSETTINSEGLVGNKVLTIYGGTPGLNTCGKARPDPPVKPAELGDIIKNLEKSSKEAEVIAQQITEITMKVNNGEGNW